MLSASAQVSTDWRRTEPDLGVIDGGGGCGTELSDNTANVPPKNISSKESGGTLFAADSGKARNFIRNLKHC